MTALAAFGLKLTLKIAVVYAVCFGGYWWLSPRDAPSMVAVTILAGVLSAIIVFVSVD